MIYTITFNPTLDYAIKIDEIKPNAFQRAEDAKIAPGGKGINTAILLHRLEVDVITIGFLGGHTGSVILNELQKEGVKTRVVPIEGMNRINLKYYHPNSQTTSVNTPGPLIRDSELNDMYRQLDEIEKDSYVVISGAIPRGVPDDIYAQLMRFLKKKNARIVIDTGAAQLRPTLAEHPFLIKPNRAEFEDFFNLSSGESRGLKKEQLIPYLKEMIDLGAQNIALTLERHGAILMDQDYQIYHADAPVVEVVSDVGAGDSFVAGFLAEYQKSQDKEAALKFGVLCGSATAASLFQATKSDLNELIRRETNDLINE